MKEIDAKKKTCPILSKVVSDHNDNHSSEHYLWIELCRGNECALWETNEPERTEGKLLDNGYCGLKHNPFI